MTIIVRRGRLAIQPELVYPNLYSDVNELNEMAQKCLLESDKILLS